MISCNLFCLSGCKEGIRLPSLLWIFGFPRAICGKISFSLGLIITKNQVTVNAKVYFCTLNSIPPICRSMFMQLPQGLPCCGFVMSFEIRKSESSLFVLFRYCFGCSGSLEFPYAFYHWLVNLCKKGKRKERHLIFAGDCTEPAVLFVERCHLNTIRSSGP